MTLGDRSLAPDLAAPADSVPIFLQGARVLPAAGNLDKAGALGGVDLPNIVLAPAVDRAVRAQRARVERTTADLHERSRNITCNALHAPTLRWIWGMVSQRGEERERERERESEREKERKKEERKKERKKGREEGREEGRKKERKGGREEERKKERKEERKEER